MSFNATDARTRIAAIARTVAAVAALAVLFGCGDSSDTSAASPQPSPTFSTDTPTLAPTFTSTSPPTQTPTATPTKTPTSTQTSTPTLTPSQTPTASPTDTPSQTPTSTATGPPLILGEAQQRPAAVILPKDYTTERRYPLVILLHGYGVTATLQDFIFRLAARATKYQFILVLPNGTQNSAGERFWNATPECCNFENTPVDDVGYLAALMQEAMDLYSVDPQRIRLVGHSNGGYMSYRYICEHPIAVDRIVVLAGSTYLDPASCQDPLPVDVLHIHGTDDDTIPYAPNLPPNADPSNILTVGAQAAVDRWAGVAGCVIPPQFIERQDYHQGLALHGDPAETEVFRYAGCTSGNRVELWRANGADHLFVTANDRWRDAVAAFLSE